MHESVMRLLDCARRATEAERDLRRVKDFADLWHRLGISSGTMTNWKARGVSKEGAIAAERIFHCSASWILEGIGPHWKHPQHSSAGPEVAPQAHELSHAVYTVTPRHVDWELLMSSPLEAEFQTVMPDHSMAPDVPKGTRIMFITGVQERGGDFVLLCDKEGNHYVREYKQIVPNQWQAHAKNAAFLPLDSVANGLRVLAVYDGMRGRRSAR